MPRNSGSSSVGLRVILYFARNPDEELTSQDVHTKFGIQKNLVYRKLNQSVIDRMLVYESPGRGHLGTYRIGPALLAMIGGSHANMPQACGGNVAADHGICVVAP